MDQEIKINPIGTVEFSEDYCRIMIQPEYKEALRELDGFGHIQVIWWGNLYDTSEHRKTRLVDKPYQESPDKIGIFATRSEIRPNPVLISVVNVINVDTEKCAIEVPWIDAEEGTPVIDIKPYHPSSDRIKNAQVPAWCAEWPQWYEDAASFDWSAVFNF